MRECYTLHPKKHGMTLIQVKGNPITISKPAPGVKAMLIDENLNPSKPGEADELFIANEYTSRQYLDLPG